MRYLLIVLLLLCTHHDHLHAESTERVENWLIKLFKCIIFINLLQSHTFICFTKLVKPVSVPVKRLVSKSGPHIKHFAFIVSFTTSTILKYFPNRSFASSDKFSMGSEGGWSVDVLTMFNCLWCCGVAFDCRCCCCSRSYEMKMREKNKFFGFEFNLQYICVANWLLLKGLRKATW